LHQPPEILLFVGRFHPLLVHLPIGMLVALAALEVLAFFPRFRNANASAGFLIALSAPLTVAAAVCGWLLSWEGGYNPDLLKLHQWLGIITAAGCVLAAVLFWRKKVVAYRLVLFLTVMVLMAAGHFGGSLTHGSDYLVRYAPGPLKQWLEAGPSGGLTEDISSRPVFAAVILPVLHNKCVSCHGPEKAKGGLRLDSFAAVMAGGENGPVIVSGNAAQSPLVQRLLLPADHDDHMPPAGKPQLTAAEIALLKWWVEVGAPERQTLAELPSPPVDAQMPAVP
jgi:uncharacterized membrane protein/mono/diheme cytochrome c family protein